MSKAQSRFMVFTIGACSVSAALCRCQRALSFLATSRERLRLSLNALPMQLTSVWKAPGVYSVSVAQSRARAFEQVLMEGCCDQSRRSQVPHLELVRGGDGLALLLEVFAEDGHVGI